MRTADVVRLTATLHNTVGESPACVSLAHSFLMRVMALHKYQQRRPDLLAIWMRRQLRDRCDCINDLAWFMEWATSIAFVVCGTHTHSLFPPSCSIKHRWRWGMTASTVVTSFQCLLRVLSSASPAITAGSRHYDGGPHRSRHSAGGREFNVFTSISRLFHRWREKVYSQTAALQ